jgi:PKD repeat protein
MVEFFNQVDSNTTYIWFFGDGATASYLSNPIHVYSSGNYYTVTLVAINPCGSDTMTQVITVEPIPTNIAESDILFESVKLYPNPAERFVNISLELLQSAELQLTWHDALGRIVYAENMAAVKGSNTQRFDMSNFAKGVYTLSIRNEQYSITKRLLLQ